MVQAHVDRLAADAVSVGMAFIPDGTFRVFKEFVWATGHVPSPKSHLTSLRRQRDDCACAGRH